MSVFYVSPSIVPSRSANSIHVVNMCEGISQLNYKVTLFAASECHSHLSSDDVINDFYGVSACNIKFVSQVVKSLKGIELLIAFRAFFVYLKLSLSNKQPRFIISRNLYAAFLFGAFLRLNIVYETHSPESGLRKFLQKWLVNSKKIRTIVISNALKNIISQKYNISGENLYVFHDAARSGNIPLDAASRKKLQYSMLENKINLQQYKKIIGYFGHLYSGRGIDVIEGVAALNKDHAFVIYGGNEADIERLRSKNTLDNLFFMGHISPDDVPNAMSMMDVLLMPYQKSVSIGLKGMDTAQWMSPMKMFEYMSMGVPIISSDLPVLREVLVDKRNALLVEADNISMWSQALQELFQAQKLEAELGAAAYEAYSTKYTWKIRAKNILELLPRS